ncbi:MAG: metallophosphoesterase [Planctomycetaceae bacterium]|nr:metallophosphoesterase [Planctomycetaceae bacterium]
MRRLAALIVLGVLALAGPNLAAGDAPAFKNGPYLLAPKPTSMVVMWEATAPGDATIAFGEGDALGEAVAVPADPDAPDFQGAKMNLYEYKLDNLKPGTRYSYEVTLAGGEKRRAGFRTLAEKPEKITIISLSDSHVFATRPKFDAAVKSFDPDLILHCGDLVEGTGAQAEQFSFFLKGQTEDDFIHSYPIVYASGNHDQGGVYFTTYVYAVQDREYGATVPGNQSFTYGNLHILSINSNPWGLFQLNSEATGAKADDATLELIDATTRWIADDLATPAAVNAEFRLAFTHHPISDAYSKRYLPGVLEPGKTDVMLSGHTHTYARAVSGNPAVAAATVYMTHQDARIHHRRCDFFRILSTPGEGLLTIEAHGANSANEETKLAATTLIARDKQQLEYSDIAITPDSVLYNGDVTVTATVTNAGTGIAAAVIPVRDNGEVRYLYRFDDGVTVLEPGKSAALTGTLRMESLGEHTLALADKTTTVAVQFRPATYDFSNVRIRMGDGDGYDLNSNRLWIKADINNIGNEAGVATAEFIIDGKAVAAKNYRLESGQTKTVEFDHTFDTAGEYAVTIGNAPAHKVFVEGSIQGMPVVLDKSGNNNNARIHGQPRLGRDGDGRAALVLDGKRDYIEVPDTGRFTATDGITGMVWANLPSAGTTKGGLTELVEPYEDLDGKGSIPDHNPLMLKGIGLGWGTPYLFRIAVRETGKVTYGVCLLNDNGEFSWNDGSQPEAGIKKDTWVQYTSSFDFDNGGDAYQNGYHSAHVDKPAFTAPMKNWEGEPLLVGLGYKNTLLSGRNRGMYHTMLPGAVSQVRFYTAKVPAGENDSVRANPTEAGASAGALKIWLDFEPGNIETTGTHTTEWVAISAAPSTLAFDAEFAGKASVVATVQTSDDGVTVKEETRIPLASGCNCSAALSGFQPARFARIVTEFTSDLNETESSVPVLHEYVLTAGATHRWNTLVDWNRGTFSGAAGHQPGDVYRDHARDIDKYNGPVDEPDAE